MKRTVLISPEAAADLAELYDFIAASGSPNTALAYIERLEVRCQSLDQFAERCTPRDDIRPGLRTVSFERRAVIAFVVEADRVTILRILYGGRNVERALES